MSLSELNQARMRHVEDARASAIELTLSDHLTPRQVRDGLLVRISVKREIP